MLDTLIFRCLALALMLIFIPAGLHKLGDMTRFVGIVADYRLLPGNLVRPAAYLLAVLEIALGVGWLIPALRPQHLPVLYWLSALLLLIYALAITINLARGRRHIDCGCGFAAGPDSGSGVTAHPLSAWHVLRNLVLVTLALLPLGGIAHREPVLLDHVVLVLALGALLFLYAALNQLLGNQGAINSWRVRSWRKSHA